MRIARFSCDGGAPQYGIHQGTWVVKIENHPAGGLEDWLSEGGPDVLSDIAVDALRANSRLPAGSVRLLAPITRPRKFLGLGGNYSSHLEEARKLGLQFPEVQIWFNKQTSCVAGPFDDVVVPSQSTEVDYEGELAVVIGRRCRRVPAERAREVIAGYMVCNDVSARDWQRRAPTATLGKSFDSHGPIGPWLVMAEDIPNPHELMLRTWVDGELRQQASTSEMRYSIWEQIAELSSVFTLEPGDILATGSPAGVGAAMQPPRFIQPGTSVRVEIEKVGAIHNTFVADDSATVIG